MTDPAPSRQERLAAKLRENLRRRKGQSRAMPPAATPATGEPTSQTTADPALATDATPALSKSPPNS